MELLARISMIFEEQQDLSGKTEAIRQIIYCYLLHKLKCLVRTRHLGQEAMSNPVPHKANVQLSTKEITFHDY